MSNVPVDSQQFDIIEQFVRCGRVSCPIRQLTLSRACIPVPLPAQILEGDRIHFPATKERPSEWTKWTAKARNGQRCYTSVPVIKEPAEFGHAVARWWNNMQPTFRKGDGVFPKDSYDDGSDGDVWSLLRKGGPNGLLSVLTLLSWWGACAIVHTQWDDPTDAMWKTTILDVTRCLEKMMDGCKKRACDDDGGQPTKR